jgi:hypothetical protein
MPRSSPNQLRLIFLFWLLIAIFYFHVSWDFIRTTMNDRSFNEYLGFVVQNAGYERRPGREIRTLLLVKAEELDLPIRNHHITILGGGETLKVAVSYEVDIQVPVFATGIYRKSYQHNAAYANRN